MKNSSKNVHFASDVKDSSMIPNLKKNSTSTDSNVSLSTSSTNSPKTKRPLHPATNLLDNASLNSMTESMFDKNTGLVDADKWFQEARDRMFTRPGNMSFPDSSQNFSRSFGQPISPLGHKSFGDGFSSHFDQIKTGDNKWQVELPVSEFDPEEIEVKLHEKSREIEIIGKHQDKKDAHGSISRQFNRRYTLPQNADISKLDSLYTNGTLTVECPLMVQQASAPRDPVKIPINRYTEI